MNRTRAYNWQVIPASRKNSLLPNLLTVLPRYISLVAALCMVLYGYDASVFNSVQGSENWVAYFDNPRMELIGMIKKCTQRND